LARGVGVSITWWDACTLYKWLWCGWNCSV